jgi:RNA polymerase sigma factor (sigma-70 family)
VVLVICFNRFLGRRCQTKIEQFHQAVWGDLDVPRFQVAMNSAPFVSGFEGLRNLPRYADRFAYSDRTLPKPLRHCQSFHQFHHQVIGTDIIELADIRMIQRRNGPGFTLEMIGELPPAKLDGHVTANAGVVRFPDFSHATRHSEAINLDEIADNTFNTSAQWLALDEALNDLATIDSRKAQVVELRFFGGLSVEETAEVLKISPQSVMRDWKLARAWLNRELGP